MGNLICRPTIQHRFRGVVALITMATFLSETIGWADVVRNIQTNPLSSSARSPSPLNVSQVFQNLNLPPSVAKIQEIHQGTLDRLVVLVQDAHANDEAQYHIAEIIKAFVAHQRLSHVYVEGASGRIYPEPLALFPQRSIRKNLADYLLKKGKLSGAEYYAVLEKSPLTLFGVENEKIYRKNREVYLSALEYKEADEKILKELYQILCGVSRYVFSKELREIRKQKVLWKQEGRLLPSYLQFLLRKAEEQGLRLDAYPALRTFARLKKLESKIRFEKIPQEIDGLHQDFQSTIPAVRLRRFLEIHALYQRHRISRSEYYREMSKELLRNASTPVWDARGRQKIVLKKKYANLLRFMKYMRLYERMDASLLEETERFEDEIKQRLYRTEEEKRLDRLWKIHEIFEKLFAFELTKSDVEFYQRHRDEFTSAAFERILHPLLKRYRFDIALPDNLSRLDQDLPKTEKFYSLALQRDRILIEKTLRKMEAARAPLSLLITGGFHTPGIEAFLKRKGYSYAVITPSISLGPSPGQDSKKYEEALKMAPVPLEELITASSLKPQSAHLQDPRFQLAAGGFLPTARDFQRDSQASEHRMNNLKTAWNLGAFLWMDQAGDLQEMKRELKKAVAGTPPGVRRHLTPWVREIQGFYRDGVWYRPGILPGKWDLIVRVKGKTPNHEVRLKYGGVLNPRRSVQLTPDLRVVVLPNISQDRLNLKVHPHPVRLPRREPDSLPAGQAGVREYISRKIRSPGRQEYRSEIRRGVKVSEQRVIQRNIHPARPQPQQKIAESEAILEHNFWRGKRFLFPLVLVLFLWSAEWIVRGQTTNRLKPLLEERIAGKPLLEQALELAKARYQALTGKPLPSSENVQQMTENKETLGLVSEEIKQMNKQGGAKERARLVQIALERFLDPVMRLEGFQMIEKLYRARGYDWVVNDETFRRNPRIYKAAAGWFEASGEEKDWGRWLHQNDQTAAVLKDPDKRKEAIRDTERILKALGLAPGMALDEKNFEYHSGVQSEVLGVMSSRAEDGWEESKGGAEKLAEILEDETKFPELLQDVTWLQQGLGLLKTNVQIDKNEIKRNGKARSLLMGWARTRYELGWEKTAGAAKELVQKDLGEGKQVNILQRLAGSAQLKAFLKRPVDLSQRDDAAFVMGQGLYILMVSGWEFEKKGTWEEWRKLSIEERLQRQFAHYESLQKVMDRHILKMKNHFGEFGRVMDPVREYGMLEYLYHHQSGEREKEMAEKARRESQSLFRQEEPRARFYALWPTAVTAGLIAVYLLFVNVLRRLMSFVFRSRSRSPPAAPTVAASPASAPSPAPSSSPSSTASPGMPTRSELRSIATRAAECLRAAQQEISKNFGLKMGILITGITAAVFGGLYSSVLGNYLPEFMQAAKNAEIFKGFIVFQSFWLGAKIAFLFLSSIYRIYLKQSFSRTAWTFWIYAALSLGIAGALTYWSATTMVWIDSDPNLAWLRVIVTFPLYWNLGDIVAGVVFGAWSRIFRPVRSKLDDDRTGAKEKNLLDRRAMYPRRDYADGLPVGSRTAFYVSTGGGSDERVRRLAFGSYLPNLAPNHQLTAILAPNTGAGTKDHPLKIAKDLVYVYRARLFIRAELKNNLKAVIADLRAKAPTTLLTTADLQRLQSLVRRSHLYEGPKKYRDRFFSNFDSRNLWARVLERIFQERGARGVQAGWLINQLHREIDLFACDLKSVNRAATFGLKDGQINEAIMLGLLGMDRAATYIGPEYQKARTDLARTRRDPALHSLYWTHAEIIQFFNQNSASLRLQPAKLANVQAAVLSGELYDPEPVGEAGSAGKVRSLPAGTTLTDLIDQGNFSAYNRALGRYEYAITLDGDNMASEGSVRRGAEILDHPANRKYSMAQPILLPKNLMYTKAAWMEGAARRMLMLLPEGEMLAKKKFAMFGKNHGRAQDIVGKLCLPHLRLSRNGREAGRILVTQDRVYISQDGRILTVEQMARAGRSELRAAPAAGDYVDWEGRRYYAVPVSFGPHGNGYDLQIGGQAVTMVNTTETRRKLEARQGALTLQVQGRPVQFEVEILGGEAFQVEPVDLQIEDSVKYWLTHTAYVPEMNFWEDVMESTAETNVQQARWGGGEIQTMMIATAPYFVGIPLKILTWLIYILFGRGIMLDPGGRTSTLNRPRYSFVRMEEERYKIPRDFANYYTQILPARSMLGGLFFMSYLALGIFTRGAPGLLGFENSWSEGFLGMGLMGVLTYAARIPVLLPSTGIPLADSLLLVTMIIIVVLPKLSQAAWEFIQAVFFFLTGRWRRSGEHFVQFLRDFLAGITEFPLSIVRWLPNFVYDVFNRIFKGTAAIINEIVGWVSSGTIATQVRQSIEQKNLSAFFSYLTSRNDIWVSPILFALLVAVNVCFSHPDSVITQWDFFRGAFPILLALIVVRPAAWWLSQPTRKGTLWYYYTRFISQRDIDPEREEELRHWSPSTRANAPYLIYGGLAFGAILTLKVLGGIPASMVVLASLFALDAGLLFLIAMPGFRNLFYRGFQKLLLAGVLLACLFTGISYESKEGWAEKAVTKLPLVGAVFQEARGPSSWNIVESPKAEPYLRQQAQFEHNHRETASTVGILNLMQTNSTNRIFEANLQTLRGLNAYTNHMEDLKGLVFRQNALSAQAARRLAAVDAKWMTETGLKTNQVESYYHHFRQVRTNPAVNETLASLKPDQQEAMRALLASYLMHLEDFELTQDKNASRQQAREKVEALAVELFRYMKVVYEELQSRLQYPPDFQYPPDLQYSPDLMSVFNIAKEGLRKFGLNERLVLWNLKRDIGFLVQNREWRIRVFVKNIYANHFGVLLDEKNPYHGEIFRYWIEAVNEKARDPRFKTEPNFAPLQEVYREFAVDQASKGRWKIQSPVVKRELEIDGYERMQVFHSIQVEKEEKKVREILGIDPAPPAPQPAESVDFYAKSVLRGLREMDVPVGAAQAPVNRAVPNGMYGFFGHGEAKPADWGMMFLTDLVAYERAPAQEKPKVLSGMIQNHLALVRLLKTAPRYEGLFPEWFVYDYKGNGSLRPRVKNGKVAVSTLDSGWLTVALIHVKNFYRAQSDEKSREIVQRTEVFVDPKQTHYQKFLEGGRLLHGRHVSFDSKTNKFGADEESFKGGSPFHPSVLHYGEVLSEAAVVISLLEANGLLPQGTTANLGAAAITYRGSPILKGFKQSAFNYSPFVYFDWTKFRLLNESAQNYAGILETNKTNTQSKVFGLAPTVNEEKRQKVLEDGIAGGILRTPLISSVDHGAFYEDFGLEQEGEVVPAYGALILRATGQEAARKNAEEFVRLAGANEFGNPAVNRKTGTAYFNPIFTYFESSLAYHAAHYETTRSVIQKYGNGTNAVQSFAAMPALQRTLGKRSELRGFAGKIEGFDQYSHQKIEDMATRIQSFERFLNEDAHLLKVTDSIQPSDRFKANPQSGQLYVDRFASGYSELSQAEIFRAFLYESFRNTEVSEHARTLFVLLKELEWIAAFSEGDRQGMVRYIQEQIGYRQDSTGYYAFLLQQIQKFVPEIINIYQSKKVGEIPSKLEQEVVEPLHRELNKWQGSSLVLDSAAKAAEFLKLESLYALKIDPILLSTKARDLRVVDGSNMERIDAFDIYYPHLGKVVDHEVMKSRFEKENRAPLIVKTNKGKKYVIKWVAGPGEESKAKYIISIMRRARLEKVPAAEVFRKKAFLQDPLNPIEGYYYELKRNYYLVEEWLDFTTPDRREIHREDAKEEDMLALGRILGQLHSAFILETDPFRAWVPDGEKQEALVTGIIHARYHIGMRRGFIDLKAEIDRMANLEGFQDRLFGSNSHLIIDQLNTAERNMPEKRYAGLPLMPVHGDASYQNVSFSADGKKVSLLFDWERARGPQPRAEEFKNAFLAAGKIGRLCDRKLLVALIRGYEETVSIKLSRDEILAIIEAIRYTFLWDIYQNLIQKRFAEYPKEEEKRIGRIMEQFKVFAADFPGDEASIDKLMESIRPEKEKMEPVVSRVPMDAAERFAAAFQDLRRIQGFDRFLLAQTGFLETVRPRFEKGVFPLLFQQIEIYQAYLEDEFRNVQVDAETKDFFIVQKILEWIAGGKKDQRQELKSYLEDMENKNEFHLIVLQAFERIIPTLIEIREPLGPANFEEYQEVVLGPLNQMISGISKNAGKIDDVSYRILQDLFERKVDRFTSSTKYQARKSTIVGGKTQKQWVQLFRREYDLQVAGEITHMNGGVSGFPPLLFNARQDDSQIKPLRYVLVLASSSLDKARFIIQAMQHARSKGVPAPPISSRKNPDSDLLDTDLLEMDGQYYFLQEFVEGRTQNRMNAGQAQFTELGKLIALLHNGFQDFNPTIVKWENPTLDILFAKRRIGNREGFLDRQEQLREKGWLTSDEEFYIKNISFILDQLEKLETRLPYSVYERLPHRSLHSDVSFENVVWDEDKKNIIGLVDWERVRHSQPRVEDFRNALLAQGPLLGRKYDKDDLLALLKGYQEKTQEKLTEHEARAIPELLRATILWDLYQRLVMNRFRPMDNRQRMIAHDLLDELRKIDQDFNSEAQINGFVEQVKAMRSEARMMAPEELKGRIAQWSLDKPLEEIERELGEYFPESRVQLFHRRAFGALWLVRSRLGNAADTIFSELYQYFRKHHEISKALIRIQDFNWRDPEMSEKNVINPAQAPAKPYEQLTLEEKDRLFDPATERLAAGGLLFHADHHYAPQLFSAISTTGLVLDYLDYLHRKGESAVLQKLTQSFGLMDHEDPDIFLSHFTVFHAQDLEFLRRYGKAIRGATMLNDYGEYQADPLSQAQASILYAIVRDLEDRLKYGRWNLDQAFDAVEEALPWMLELSQKGFNDAKLFEALRIPGSFDFDEESAILRQMNGRQLEIARMFFAGAKAYMEDRGEILKLMATYESSATDIRPGTVRKIGPILFFYFVGDMDGASVMRYLRTERPEVFDDVFALVISDFSQGGRWMKFRSFDREIEWGVRGALNLIPIFNTVTQDSRFQGRYPRAGGRPRAGGLGKNPFMNVDEAWVRQAALDMALLTAEAVQNQFDVRVEVPPQPSAQSEMRNTVVVKHQGRTYLKAGHLTFRVIPSPDGKLRVDLRSFKNARIAYKDVFEKFGFALPTDDPKPGETLRFFPVRGSLNEKGSDLYPSLRADPVLLKDLKRSRSTLARELPETIREIDLENLVQSLAILGLHGNARDYHSVQSLIQEWMSMEEFRNYRELLKNLSERLLLSYVGVDWDKWIRLKEELKHQGPETGRTRTLTLYEKLADAARLNVHREELEDWRIVRVQALGEGDRDLPSLAADPRLSVVQKGQSIIDRAEVVSLIFAGGSATVVKKMMGQHKLIHAALKVAETQKVRWISLFEARMGLLLGQNPDSKAVVITNVGGTQDGESDRSVRAILSKLLSEKQRSQVSVQLQKSGFVLDPKTGNPLRHQDGRLAMIAEGHLWTFLSLLMNKEKVLDILKHTSGILSAANGDNILGYPRPGMIGEILAAEEQGRAVATVAVMAASAGDRKGGFAAKVTYRNRKTGKEITQLEIREVSEFPTRDRSETKFTGIDLNEEKDGPFYREAEARGWFIEDIFRDEQGREKKVAFNAAFYAINLRLFTARIFGFDERDPELPEYLGRIEEQDWVDRILEVGNQVFKTIRPHKEVPNEDGSLKVSGHMPEQAIQDFIVNSLSLLQVRPELPKPEALFRLGSRADDFIPYKGETQNVVDENGAEVPGAPPTYDLIANQRHYVGALRRLLKKGHRLVLPHQEYVQAVIPVDLEEVQKINADRKNPKRSESRLAQAVASSSEQRFQARKVEWNPPSAKIQELERQWQEKLSAFAQDPEVLERLGLEKASSLAALRDQGVYILDLSSVWPDRVSSEEILKGIERLLLKRASEVRIVVFGRNNIHSLIEEKFKEAVKQRWISLPQHEEIPEFVGRLDQSLKTDMIQLKTPPVAAAALKHQETEAVAVGMMDLALGRVVIVSRRPVEGVRQITVAEVMAASQTLEAVHRSA